MVRRKLTIPERWQAVGMNNGGFSHRRVADQFRVNHSIIVRLMQCFRQTGNVTDRPRAGRLRKTTPREDRLISKRARQRPFSRADALRGNLAFGGHISIRTAIRRLHHQGMRARRPIKRPRLTLRHRHARCDWSHDHLGWTIHTWRRVQWSDESRFCYALPTVVQGFGANETLHFRTTTFWAQLLLGWGCNCLGLFFL
jgi:transposase